MSPLGGYADVISHYLTLAAPNGPDRSSTFCVHVRVLIPNM